MSSFTVRDLPERTVATLKSRALRNNRTLNGEILCIFDYVASLDAGFDFPPPPCAPSRAQGVRDAVLDLAGRWEDSRPITDTISDAESGRTPGREVAL